MPRMVGMATPSAATPAKIQPKTLQDPPALIPPGPRLNGIYLVNRGLFSECETLSE